MILPPSHRLGRTNGFEDSDGLVYSQAVEADGREGLAAYLDTVRGSLFKTHNPWRHQHELFLCDFAEFREQRSQGKHDFLKAINKRKIKALPPDVQVMIGEATKK